MLKGSAERLNHVICSEPQPAAAAATLHALHPYASPSRFTLPVPVLPLGGLPAPRSQTAHCRPAACKNATCGSENMAEAVCKHMVLSVGSLLDAQLTASKARHGLCAVTQL